MIVAADIGGTKTDIALLEPPGDALAADRSPRFLHKAQYPSARYPDLTSIVGDFIKRHDVRPGSVQRLCAGIAGPVVGGRVETPNLPWVVHASQMESALGIGSVTLLNDLEAAAERAATLGPSDVFVLNAGRRPEGPLTAGAVIAAGTGLGMAILFPQGGAWWPVASEGGHMDFAPRNELEMDLLRFLARRHGQRVSNERVLSGPGLRSLYDFLSERKEQPAAEEVAEAIARNPAEAPRIIGEAGLARSCAVCDCALDLFVTLYGSIAGNLALMSVSSGGLFIGGGVAPKLLERFKAKLFLEAFLDKGRLSPLLERMPVCVILDREAGLSGAARRAMRLELGLVPEPNWPD